MRNPWFHFKQFSVRQDRAAMKVCTDSCVFGAWVSERTGCSARILDIGTGTGLLTLMLAQKKQADEGVSFEAIELDQPSHDQAAANFAGSAWRSKIILHSGDVSHFSFTDRFDFVVVNPPFYERQLRSPEPALSSARHETSLTLAGLILVLKRVLTTDGPFAILLPADREDFFSGLAADAGYLLSERCHLKQTTDHQAFRSMMLFRPAELPVPGESLIYRPGATEITLRDKDGRETPELLEIMKDYYLR